MVMRVIAQIVFGQLRLSLCSSPVLKLPNFTKPFVMELDASDVAVEVFLLQHYDNGLHLVAYFSKKYVSDERNYASYNKELLAIFKACQKRRCYLDGHQTTVFTDIKKLLYLHT